MLLKKYCTIYNCCGNNWVKGNHNKNFQLLYVKKGIALNPVLPTYMCCRKIWVDYILSITVWPSFLHALMTVVQSDLVMIEPASLDIEKLSVPKVLLCTKRSGSLKSNPRVGHYRLIELGWHFLTRLRNLKNPEQSGIGSTKSSRMKQRLFCYQPEIYDTGYFNMNLSIDLKTKTGGNT